jgi:hypothetical protein
MAITNNKLVYVAFDVLTKGGAVHENRVVTALQGLVTNADFILRPRSSFASSYTLVITTKIDELPVTKYILEHCQISLLTLRLTRYYPTRSSVLLFPLPKKS